MWDRRRPPPSSGHSPRPHIVRVGNYFEKMYFGSFTLVIVPLAVRVDFGGLMNWHVNCKGSKFM